MFTPIVYCHNLQECSKITSKHSHLQLVHSCSVWAFDSFCMIVVLVRIASSFCSVFLASLIVLMNCILASDKVLNLEAPCEDRPQRSFFPVGCRCQPLACPTSDKATSPKAPYTDPDRTEPNGETHTSLKSHFNRSHNIGYQIASKTIIRHYLKKKANMFSQTKFAIRNSHLSTFIYIIQALKFKESHLNKTRINSKAPKSYRQDSASFPYAHFYENFPAPNIFGKF